MALAPDDMGGTERGDAIRLVAAHRSGDTSAFTEIVRTHYPTLLACARRRLTNLQDAEDAVQEAFLRAYRRLETFGSGGDWRLGAWLNTIVCNVCTDILVRRRPSAPFEEWAEGRIDERPDPVDLVSDHLVLQAVTRAIATLPESQRNAFVLRMVDGRPYEEVAATLGITTDNARARVARARNALKRALARSEALTGMLAGTPLLVAGSLRSALRRVFSASEPAHATAATGLATNVTTATEVAASSGSLGTGMQLLGQLAATPAGQVALVAASASASSGARAPVVLGVVASLAAAGSLSAPAVAAVTAASAPSAVVQYAPRLASSVTGPAQSAPPTAPVAASGGRQMPGAAPASPPPSWMSLAASAAVDDAPAPSSGSPSSAPSSLAAGTTSPAAPSASTASAATVPASTAGSGAPASAVGAPAAQTVGSIVSLPIGTCATVLGFAGVTAPSSVPPLSSASLKAVMSTGPHAMAPGGGAPAFQATGSMITSSSSSAPVNVAVGTCLAENGSILAVDMTGSTGAEVQLVGSLVAAPATATATGGGRTILYLFRGQVSQIGGAPLPGGRLPWHLSSSFVAEVQVQPDDMASLEVVFLQPMGAAVTAPDSTTPTTTSPTATAGAPSPTGAPATPQGAGGGSGSTTPGAGTGTSSGTSGTGTPSGTSGTGTSSGTSGTGTSSGTGSPQGATPATGHTPSL